MDPTAAREEFARLVGQPGEGLDLARGALLISAEENPGVDPAPHLERLERWAGELRPRLRRAGGDLEKIELLRGFLYGDKGLEGNREDYYDPANSFLDQVLERRLGIPLTLAVVLLEVGRRAGVPLVGIGFPGHFLVRHGHHPQIFLDPFDGGQFLTREDCSEILQRLTRGKIPFSPQLLTPVGPRQILLRMLNNLCGIYFSRGQVHRSLAVVERKMLLFPQEPCYLRERGVLRLKAGLEAEGSRDLEAYLEARPDADDWDQIAGLLEEVREGEGPSPREAVH